MIKIHFYKTTLVPLTKSVIESLVHLVAQHEKKLRGEIEIHCITESEIQDLNRRYRGKNKPTDVLSFAWTELPKEVWINSKVFKKYLGEIYLCPKYIKEQAQRFKVGNKEEFIRMLVHGLLHLVGYDHDIKKRAQRMFGFQEEIVKKILKNIENKR